MSTQGNAPTLEIPPPVSNAPDVVAVVRRQAGLFETYPHHRAEDVIGCLVYSLITFRGDYLPRGRTLSSDDHRIASIAVFRDFCTHGRDLLSRAGWWPTLWVPQPSAEAFSRFLSWVDDVLDLALASRQAPTDARLRSVFAIWWGFVIRNAERAGRIDRGALLGDIRRALTEAGLRGPDGLAPVSLDDLVGEAALVQLAAERHQNRMLYIDRSGRGRISHRAAARVHPNRAQRMPSTPMRRAFAKAMGRQAMTPPGESSGSVELETTLRAQRLRRAVSQAESGRSRIADAAIDLRELVNRLRERVSARGRAADAALTYLLPRVLGVGARVSRDAAARSVAPPVSIKALRHQETYLQPLICAVRSQVEPEVQN